MGGTWNQNIVFCLSTFKSNEKSLFTRDCETFTDVANNMSNGTSHLTCYIRPPQNVVYNY